MKTELKNRTLWYDGTNQVEPEDVPQLILDGVPIDKIVVSHLNEDLITFNTLEDVEFPMSKAYNLALDRTWVLPKSHQDLNLSDYIIDKFNHKFGGHKLRDVYYNRLICELNEIEQRHVADLFRALIYITETLIKSKTVFGVGRGSSCASLFLYILGLHKVDPVKYDIPLSEFFHD